MEITKHGDNRTRGRDLFNGLTHWFSFLSQLFCILRACNIDKESVEGETVKGAFQVKYVPPFLFFV